MSDLWAVRLNGNLVGGLFVHGCIHVGKEGEDPRCSIQTAEALKPEAALYFGDRKKAKAVAALCPEGAEVVRIELDNDKHDGGAGGPCLRCPSCEGGHPIWRPGGREACIGCGHERCKEGGPSPRPILEDS